MTLYISLHVLFVIATHLLAFLAGAFLLILLFNATGPSF